jgi:hypothetical protein
MEYLRDVRPLYLV